MEKSIFLYFFHAQLSFDNYIEDTIDSFLIFDICQTVLVQLLYFPVLSSFIATNCSNYDFANIIEMD